VDFIQPRSWADALAAKSAHPDAVPIAGGTDVMVELNFDKSRPAALLDLNRVTELAEWTLDDGRVRLGAGVTYTRVIDELADQLPALAIAARTIGSPQIRNRGTVGGNLGAASPAGDSHPPLLAVGAEVEVASVRGTRRIAASEFYTGVKRNALATDELIAAILLPRALGPQQFCKIGTRNAMVIAVATFAVALDPAGGRVGTGIGSAAPTPIRATDAETFLADALAADNLWQTRRELPAVLLREFGARVSAATAPIDDVRGTAAYRRHAMTVMAVRALGWAWDDYREVA